MEKPKKNRFKKRGAENNYLRKQLRNCIDIEMCTEGLLAGHYRGKTLPENIKLVVELSDDVYTDVIPAMIGVSKSIEYMTDSGIQVLIKNKGKK